MSQQENSQKVAKEQETCGTCFGSFKLLQRDGTSCKYEPRSNPSLGSYMAPSMGSMFLPSTTNTGAWTISSDNVNYGKPLVSQATAGSAAQSLSHPPWTEKINCILCLARASFRTLFTDNILSKQQTRLWNEFFHAGNPFQAQTGRRQEQPEQLNQQANC